MKELLRLMKKDVDTHWADSQRHIDPTRDGASQKALTKRLDRIEEKLDELLTGQQRARQRKQGDSDDE